MEKGEGKAVSVSCFFPSPKKAIRLFGAKIKVESVKFIFGITHLLSLFCDSKIQDKTGQEEKSVGNRACEEGPTLLFFLY